MAYNNMPFGQDVARHPFYNYDIKPQNYRQEGLDVIEDSWMQNIDPLLRQVPRQDTWQQQQQPIQKWFTEPERPLFTAAPLQSRPQTLPQNFIRRNDGVSSLPMAPRMVSPSPSYDLSSQSSNSARSPGAEPELYQDSSYYSPPQDDHSLPSATSQFSQGLPDLWQGHPQIAFPPLPGYNCVNLSQVQAFADLQDGTFEADEGYPEMEFKDYTIEVDTHKSHHNHSHSYRHSPSDEGLGTSLKDEGSPHANPTQDIEDADADAEADLDDEAYPTSPLSDTEYTPKSTRTRKRKATTRIESPQPTRRRMTKSPAKRSPHTCKSCSHAPFKDAAALQRHVNADHTRAFICVFAFAGCVSTFASKNEWKRHVSSQHLNLYSWVCEIGQCAKANKDGKGGEFNRKDLFTQHLRRMHAPFDVKRKGKKNLEWEDRVRDLQSSCMRVKRMPPARLRCCVRDCETVFEGPSAWDDRMEHVGKHLEKSTSANAEVVRQEDDELLVNWALRERIVERAAGGGFKLAGAWYERGDDEDADGEIDD